MSKQKCHTSKCKETATTEVRGTKLALLFFDTVELSGVTPTGGPCAKKWYRNNTAVPG